MSNYPPNLLDFLHNLHILVHMNEYMQKVKEYRLRNNLSQEQLAKIIGVSRPTYTSMESGKQKIGVEEAQRIANLLGVSVDEFLSGNTPNIEKYKQMILNYLRLDISSDSKIPKTKLAKLLYLADFAWFYDHIESMSGMLYRKIPYGPVPDTFFRALDELINDGKVTVDQKLYDGNIISLVSENANNKNEKLTTLSTKEKALMKKIAKKWKDQRTQDIVNFTHNQLPYSLCRPNEIIPYELITQEDPDMLY